VPVLLSSLFVGTVVDMVGRKRVALLSDVLSVLSAAGISLLAVLGHLDAGWLIGLAFLTLLPRTLHELDDLRESAADGAAHVAVPTPYPGQ
jgi:hypothetical protein